MDEFWDWVAGKIGRDKAFSLRVWAHDWLGLALGAFGFVLLGYILVPYVYETHNLEGYIEGRVVSFASLPGDEYVPPGASFVVDIGDGQVVQVSTRHMELAETVRDTACLRETVGDATAFKRYALAPQGFCKPET